MLRMVSSVPLTAWVAVGLIGLGGLGWATVNSERSDCPGKIECPLTGELVCEDRCPAGPSVANAAEAERPDCPGKIECPLTGEPVCEDRCPVGAPAENEAETETALSCCEIGK